VFGLGISIACLVMPIFGGLYTISGPIIGTIVIKAVEEYLRVTISYGHQIAYGLILVVVVLFMPEGVVGVWRRKILPLLAAERKNV
jgi:branched-chain amino acid transport system permease protein